MSNSKGWVYIITNKAMPGLIKVGLTSRGSDVRALELGGTGNPHPYVVEYDMLIDGDPVKYEQLTHKSLGKFKEGKEWFRCSISEGVSAIRDSVGGAAIEETIHYEDREKKEIESQAASLRRKAEHESKLKLRAEEKRIKEEIAKRESAVKERNRIKAIDTSTRELLSNGAISWWVLGVSILILISNDFSRGSFFASLGIVWINLYVRREEKNGAVDLRRENGLTPNPFVENKISHKPKERENRPKHKTNPVLLFVFIALIVLILLAAIVNDSNKNVSMVTANDSEKYKPDTPEQKESKANVMPEAQKRWLSNNKWYNLKDESTESILANKLYQDLISEGYVDSDDSTYSELDVRLNNLKAKSGEKKLNKKLSMNHASIDIRELFKLLSSVTGVKISASKSVKGNVSAYYSDIYPMDIFNNIININNLSYTYEDGGIYVFWPMENNN